MDRAPSVAHHGFYIESKQCCILTFYGATTVIRTANQNFTGKFLELSSCYIACTMTLFNISFRSFRQSASDRNFLLPPPLPPCAGGQEIPAVFIIFDAGSTDFEEKIEGL